MAATNINVVVLTGNLTRDPELRSLPSGMSVCSLRIASNTRRKDQSRRVGGQAELLRRDRLGRPGRELRALPLQGPPGRARRPPRVARVAGAGRRRSARASRSSPTPSSSSAAATTAPSGGGGFTPQSDVPGDNQATSSRRARLRAAAPPPRTTTSPSRRRAPHPSEHGPGAPLRGRFSLPTPVRSTSPGRVAARLPQWTTRAPRARGFVRPRGAS